VLFHRAAGLSEAWGFNARVRPHQTEEKAVDQSSDVVTLENVFEKKENANRRESSFGGSVKRHPPNTNDDEKRKKHGHERKNTYAVPWRWRSRLRLRTRS